MTPKVYIRGNVNCIPGEGSKQCQSVRVAATLDLKHHKHI